MKTIAVIIIALMFPLVSFAEIVITNGFWSTSYDCDDWTDGYDVLDCDGLESGPVGYCSGDDYAQCLQDATSWAEQILSAYNRSDGVSGTGAGVHYLFNGGHNNQSSGNQVVFPSPLNEYWFRFYIYYKSTMDFNNNYYKTLYIDIDSSHQTGWIFNFPAWDNLTRFWISETSTSWPPDDHSYDGEWGQGADWLGLDGGQGYDRWVMLEYHCKMDTDGTDGILQLWVDDVLAFSYDNVDFGYTSGFEMIRIGSNYGLVTSSEDTHVPIAYDDLALATPDYTGFSYAGTDTARIGPFIPGSAAITAPTNLTATKVE